MPYKYITQLAYLSLLTQTSLLLSSSIKLTYTSSRIIRLGYQASISSKASCKSTYSLVSSLLSTLYYNYTQTSSLLNSFLFLSQLAYYTSTQLYLIYSSYKVTKLVTYIFNQINNYI